MNNSSTSANPTAEKVALYVLVGMTAVTGLVDAVSFLSLGRVFTANMTGNILLLAFATARVSGLSVARSSTALIAFFFRRDTRRTDHVPRDRRFTDPIRGTSIPDRGDLSLCGVVLQHRIQKRFAGTFFSTACSDRLHGAGHGHAECCCSEARNPGYDDDRPDINGHGHRCGLPARERQQPEIGEESWFSLGNLFRRSARCSCHTLLDLSGARACDRNLRRLQRCVVSLIAHVRSAVTAKLAGDRREPCPAERYCPWEWATKIEVHNFVL